ncbi:hypothetical protein [Halorubrum ezzemoulense]|uniref:hypothetical protein n=1 Tax=Halorubrum ezzemoulense TaxID=337243 RepID=UPI00200B809D|nr:hypothetical protein [Halorubrum ezzemoulense]
MFALPHFSSRIVVGIGSSCIAVVGWSFARSMRGFPTDPHLWLPRLVVRSVADIRRLDRIAVVWIGLIAWSVTVTALHFAGVTLEIYSAISWWDLLTHSMSGFGIAALAVLTHRDRVAMDGSVWWVVPTIVAVGAGFEVYEFAFKAFWHDWTVRKYVVDTVVDLVMNTLGGTVVTTAASGYLTAIDRPRPDSSSPNHAD